MKKLGTKKNKTYIDAEIVKHHFTEKLLMFMFGIGFGYIVAIIEINLK